MTRPRTLAPRKLLVAAVGVATVNFVAVGCVLNNETSGNLMGLPNTTDAAPDRGVPPTSGNLMAPPPQDAASEADADDAGDAGDASDTDAEPDGGDLG